MTLNNQIKLDPVQRQEAEELWDDVAIDPQAAAYEIVALRKVARLASELCTAIDNSEKDIGGSRHIRIILADLGPACDAVKRSLA